MLDGAAEVLGSVLAKVFGSANAKEVRRLAPPVAEINALEPETARLSDA